MYPISLEKQYQKFFHSEFQRLAKPFTAAVIQKLKNEIKADSDDSVRADSVTEMMLFLADLRGQYGNKIDSKELAGKVEKNYRLIDAWSRDKTNESIAKLYARLNTQQPQSVTGRPPKKNQSGELWLTTVNLRRNFNEDLLAKTVKTNVSLINEAYKEHFDEITGIIKSGVLSGKGSKAIANELMAATGVNESKARFWASDQAGKFFGETTKLRQKAAGIPGYIWRCVGPPKTRDSHLALEGTYHTWDNPPMVQSGRTLRPLNPGEDYRCRCWPEPALGPEAAEREYEIPADDDYFESIRPGTEPANFDLQGRGGLWERIAFGEMSSTLKGDAETGLSAIDSVIDLKGLTGIKKAVSISVMPAGIKDYDKTMGVFSPKSDSIMLNPDNILSVSTMIHEFGHWAERRLITDASFNRKFIKAIGETEMYRAIRKAEVSTAFRNYLLTPSELFSRCFEQYVGDKTGNKIASVQTAYKIAENPYQYLVDGDKKIVYGLFEDIFKGMGIKK